jgi:hypothetical protein
MSTRWWDGPASCPLTPTLAGRQPIRSSLRLTRENGATTAVGRRRRLPAGGISVKAIAKRDFCARAVPSRAGRCRATLGSGAAWRGGLLVGWFGCRPRWPTDRSVHVSRHPARQGLPSQEERKGSVRRRVTPFSHPVLTDMSLLSRQDRQQNDALNSHRGLQIACTLPH